MEMVRGLIWVVIGTIPRLVGAVMLKCVSASFRLKIKPPVIVIVARRRGASSIYRDS
jgi:hypothetical protein